MKKIECIRWEYIVLIISSLFSMQLGQKGFAGFDLSPMISANNILKSGLGNNYSIDNPMSPGFTFIVYIFTLPFQNNYLSFFFGNQLFVSALLITSLFLINFYSKNNFINESTAFISKNIAILICIPTLITDGHFYISDTSDIFCCTLILLTSVHFISVTTDNPKKSISQRYIKNIIIFISSFSLFLKPNIGIPTFLYVIGLVFLEEAEQLKSKKISIIELIKDIIYIVLGIIIWIYILTSTINININNYISTIKLISQNRSSLNLSLIDIKLIFPLTILSGPALHNLINLVVLTSIFILTLIFFSKNILKIGRSGTVLLCTILTTYTILNNQYSLSGFNLIALILLTFYCSVFFLLKHSNYQKPNILIFTGLGLCVGLLSIICLATNFDVKSSDFPILFTSLGIGMLIVSSYCNYQIKSKKFIALFVLMILLMLGVEGYQRIKIILAGPPSGFREFSFVINNQFFKKLKTTKFHQEVDSEIEDFMKSIVIKNNNSIMFGPRLEYLYSQYELIPPANLPLWWHVGTSYSESHIPAIIDALSSPTVKFIVFEKFGDSIDSALMDKETLEFITNSSEFRIFRKNKNTIIYVKEN